MTTEERFERIEAMLAKFAEGMIELRDGQKRLQSGHIELEAAQVNQLKTHTRLEEALTKFSTATAERISNLTILLDRLVARDLGSL